MSEAKHAPDDWRIERDVFGDGEEFEYVEYVIVTEEDEIARCYDEDNARLMAAAKELHEAAKNFFASLEKTDRRITNSDLGRHLARAIRKAEGDDGR